MSRGRGARAALVPVAGAVLAASVAACTPALRKPPPVTAPRGAPTDEPVYQLLREADAAWARRASLPEARKAEQLYMAAAAEDPMRVEGLLGGIRAKIYIIENDPSAKERDALAVSAVQAGQWCLVRAPTNPSCAYLLAISLGQQARERPTTAADGIAKMVDLLHELIARDPRLDGGGPHRVLALLLLRAPSWPVGPGDPEAALTEARAAAALFPDRADNEVVLAEALRKNGHDSEARRTYERARVLGEQALSEGDPDAKRWLDDAKAGLSALGPAPRPGA